MSNIPQIVDFKFIDEGNSHEDRAIDDELDSIINESDDESEEELIKMEEKPEIDVDEIFELQEEVEEPVEEPKEEAHPVFEPPLEPEPPKPKPKPKRVKPVKLNKDGTERKKRAPLTEAEKEQRRQNLKKAHSANKIKTQEKLKERELAKKEKELLKKKKIKDVERLEKEVNQDEAEPPEPTIKPSGLTKEDLIKSQYDAIMAYEKLRKDRKAEKRKQQLIDNEKKKMLNHIHSATVGYKYRDGSNPFDRCF